MLKSMMRKEIRELAPILVTALLLQFFLLSTEGGMNWGPLYMIGWPEDYSAGVIPFVSSYSFVFNCVVGAIGAIAIGLSQSMGESRRGTFLFLLHRPASRESIIGAKLLIGGLLTFLIMAIPILFYSIWAAVPGTHASPFFWSMTKWAWNFAALWVLVYLGAFLSGLRVARWYVSRFWPIIAALMLVPVLNLLFWPETWLEPFGALGVLATGAALTMSVMYIGRTRDYS
jgi:hypothetical protein